MFQQFLPFVAMGLAGYLAGRLHMRAGQLKAANLALGLAPGTLEAKFNVTEDHLITAGATALAQKLAGGSNAIGQ